MLLTALLPTNVISKLEKEMKTAGMPSHHNGSTVEGITVEAELTNAA
jgi:hypothetical protein